MFFCLFVCLFFEVFKEEHKYNGAQSIWLQMIVYLYTTFHSQCILNGMCNNKSPWYYYSKHWQRSCGCCLNTRQFLKEDRSVSQTFDVRTLEKNVLSQGLLYQMVASYYKTKALGGCAFVSFVCSKGRTHITHVTISHQQQRTRVKRLVLYLKAYPVKKNKNQKQRKHGNSYIYVKAMLLLPNSNQIF